MDRHNIRTDIDDDEERAFEKGLRPQRLADYVGQEKIKANLKVYIEAAKLRGEPLDHILLYGPPGLGKTTLAGIIANEMGSRLVVTSGPAIEKTGDLASILVKLGQGDVLFIDEIHRLDPQVEEMLYPAMEDFKLDVIIGSESAQSRSINMKLKPFTLVGATTRAGMLTAPLRARFGVMSRLEFYTDAELTQIIVNSADKLDVSIDIEGAGQLASRSRGTPRIANRLLKRVRDFAMVRYDGVITKEVVDDALHLMEIDEMGLDETDRRVLEAMIKLFHGRPVGLKNLAASIGEDAATIEDVYEPFLLQKGLIIRTPRGRQATRAAYEHLKLMSLYREEEEQHE